MVRLLMFVLLLYSSTVSAVSYMLLPIDSVYDGDTINTHVDERRLPFPLYNLSIRIKGIDTPELGWRADCDKERELAIQARDHVIWLAEGHRVMKVSEFKWDKYGGRIVAVVSIGGVNVADSLISKGLAVPYDGGTKTHDWCQ